MRIFNSRLLLLLLIVMTGAMFLHTLTFADPGETLRVSLNSGGLEGNNGSRSPAISRNGRFVAFASEASNLFSGDSNDASDIFVRDRQLNTTSRVSVATGGIQANGPSFAPALSDDGRFVAFESFATNLVSLDTNGLRDVFVHDRQTNTTVRVSVDSSGTQANGDSYAPSISGDGRFEAFVSSATNLVGADTNGVSDIFVRDLQMNTTIRVSVDSGGAQANGDSYAPSISGDGRFVAFVSSATNLVGADTNGVSDIFVRDLQMNTTIRVSVDSGGAQANGNSYDPAISGNGLFVAFASESDNLVSADTNNASDIFVRDLQAGVTSRVSIATGGDQSNDESYFPAISDDGTFVVFTSDATNLVVNDTNGFRDIFIHNRQDNTTFRVSVDTAGMQTNDDSFLAALSGNGLVVVFESDADNLVADDSNVARDIFVNLQRFASLITSANSVTFTVGNAGAFTVLTTGTPVPALSVSGALPAGVSFIDNGNGTATIAGTPASGSGGVYALTLTASNGVAPDATQVFTLTVQEAPAITSAASVAFVVGASGTFTVSATGFPAPVLNVSSVLPAGVSFIDNGNGTATIAGTPASGSGGVYALTLTASNGVAPDAIQVFTLTVGGLTQVLAITSASDTTFIVGQPGSFTVTAIGFLPPALSYTGTLPPGVVFNDNGDGTATLSGTPITIGSFPLIIAASDGVGPSIIQRFTLRVYATQVFLPLVRQ
ncbi:MAG: putative Ig domain-containing protein [Chloroflexaceae bacterium]